MSYRVRDVRCLLGYAGLLPFILALLAPYISSLVTPQLAYYLFASYSLLIASFMCGALWGEGLGCSRFCSIRPSSL